MKFLLPLSRAVLVKAAVVILSLPISLYGSPQQQRRTFASWGVHPEYPASVNLPSQIRYKKNKVVKVAIIDTGIDPTHPYIKENLYVPKSLRAPKNAFGIDYSPRAKDLYKPYDNHGHGTHIAGIIKSVTPNVKFFVLKYYNPKATGEENLKATLKALRVAIESKVDIINYSGGGPESCLEEIQLLKKANQLGILVVAAAGNMGANIDLPENGYYPASYNLPNILTVAAYDLNLKILPSSNFSKHLVHIAAPGYSINSSLPNNQSGRLTGTSQATAFVSGTAALLLSHFKLKPMETKKIIIDSGKEIKDFTGKIASSKKLNIQQAIKVSAHKTKTKPVKVKRALATQKNKKKIEKNKS